MLDKGSVLLRIATLKVDKHVRHLVADQTVGLIIGTGYFREDKALARYMAFVDVQNVVGNSWIKQDGFINTLAQIKILAGYF